MNDDEYDAFVRFMRDEIRERKSAANRKRR